MDTREISSDYEVEPRSAEEAAASSAYSHIPYFSTYLKILDSCNRDPLREWWTNFYDRQSERYGDFSWFAEFIKEAVILAEKTSSTNEPLQAKSPENEMRHACD